MFREIDDSVVLLFIDLPHFFRFPWVLFSKVMFSALFDFTIRTPVQLLPLQMMMTMSCGSIYLTFSFGGIYFTFVAATYILLFSRSCGGGIYLTPPLGKPVTAVWDVTVAAAEL